MLFRSEGVVHVTTTEAIAAGYLLPQVPALRARHPGIELIVSCAERRLDLGKRPRLAQCRATAGLQRLHRS